MSASNFFTPLGLPNAEVVKAWNILASQGMMMPFGFHPAMMQGAGAWPMNPFWPAQSIGEALQAGSSASAVGSSKEMSTKEEDCAVKTQNEESMKEDESMKKEIATQQGDVLQNNSSGSVQKNEVSVYQNCL